MRTTITALSIVLILSTSWYWLNLPQTSEPPLANTSTATHQEEPIQAPLNLTNEVGQFFIIGHWADQPVASTTERIKKYGVGGVIIMSAPEDPRDITRWVNEWQSVSSSTLLIAIDQEGGPVSRLKGPNFIATGQRNITDSETAFAVGKARGEELASLGINLNFAPVLDTADNPDSFMYGRVFPKRDESARLATAMIEGMSTAGVTGVIKHFPGHDDTADDSHAVLPTVSISKDSLSAFTEPFRELISENPPPALMTAHVAFPNIDSLPATLSSFWLSTYLRDTLGYQGAIITDDMIMDAIDQTWPHEEAAVMALQAGADIILYAAEPEKVGEAIAAVVFALNEGRLSNSQLSASLDQIKRLKEPKQ